MNGGLECVICLIVDTSRDKRAPAARTVVGGAAVCLDHVTALITEARSVAVRDVVATVTALEKRQ